VEKRAGGHDSFSIVATESQAENRICTKHKVYRDPLVLAHHDSGAIVATRAYSSSKPVLGFPLWTLMRKESMVSSRSGSNSSTAAIGSA
jgi:hypothetical protein